MATPCRSRGVVRFSRFAACQIQGLPMFIAMNRFKVVKGEEAAFETVWSSRKTRLDEMPGFLSFHLLKGPEKEDHTL